MFRLFIGIVALFWLIDQFIVFLKFIAKYVDPIIFKIIIYARELKTFYSTPIGMAQFIIIVGCILFLIFTKVRFFRNLIQRLSWNGVYLINRERD